jgi:3-hydroxyacyl-[acyl-carrier-protein] dehydratase
MKAVYGLDRIKSSIPHRPPILLVDRIDEVVPGSRLVGRKAISGNEPCYAELGQDAAASAYEYPRALVIESWAQAAVLLAVWTRPNPDVLAGKVELAGAINGVVFGGPALPGDVLVHEVRLVRAIDDTAIVAGRTTVGDSPVLEIDSFVVALRDVTELRPVQERQPASV